jgi:phosphoglycolate phosphatase
MDIRLLICDLDGTLLDTLADIAAACNHALAELGQPTHPADDYRMMVGEGADVLVRRALPAGRQDLAEQALRLFKAYYETHPHDVSRPYSGIPELLEALTARGVKLAVLTNKPHSIAQRVIGALLGTFPWIAIVGQREGVPKKPDPFAAWDLARDARIAPAQCAFLGDSKIDMQTAVAAGMLPLGAAWGFRSREELLTHGARLILDHPVDLLEPLTRAPTHPLCISAEP